MKTAEKITTLDTLSGLRPRMGQVVFTNGVFDILHPGHVALLETARGLGDVLIVGVNDDTSVRRLKGPTRPVQPVEARMRVLAGLSSVSWVFPFVQDTPLEAIKILHPDVLVKGGDYTLETIVGAPEVVSWGGHVFIVQLVEGESTTAILNRLTSPTP